MRGLSNWALNNSMLVLALLVIVLVGGPFSFLTHPSREDPEITIRTAVVSAKYPGMSAQRIEDLITRKLEEKIREMPEVEKIISTSRAGRSTVNVELKDKYTELEPIWQDLRNKISDVQGQLPSGTPPPEINDDYGAVSMATIALTAEGFSRAEMRTTARDLKNLLYGVSGVSKVELFGVEEERIYIELNNSRLAQTGLSAQGLIDAVSNTNVISPGGRHRRPELPVLPWSQAAISRQ